MSEPITLTTYPTSQQLGAAARLLNANGHLPHQITANRLRQARFVVLALNDKEEVVGMQVLKKSSHPDMVEVGWLIVHPDYRRRGMATQLKKRAINEAINQQLALLYARTERNNPNVFGLQKLGFHFWGTYCSPHDPNRHVSWFYLPLSHRGAREAEAFMQEITAHLAKTALTPQPLARLPRGEGESVED